MESPAKVYIVTNDVTTQNQVARLSGQLGLRSHIYNSAEDFMRDYDGHRPACLVTEFRLPELDGVRLQEALLRERIRMPVVFITAVPETRAIVRAVQNGAIAVFDKPADDFDLSNAIASALKRDRQIQRIDSQHVELRQRVEQLTPKECQVLDLMMDGLPNKVIAKRLGVSLRTVEVRRQQVFRKTGTRSVAQLVQLVLAVREPASVAVARG